jgi:hypothetical protein
MILCEWDAPEGDPGQSCVQMFACILSTSFSSVSMFSVCCYSSVSISMVCTEDVFGWVGGGGEPACVGWSRLKKDLFFFWNFFQNYKIIEKSLFYKG